MTGVPGRAWDLSVASGEALGSWRDAAARLRAVMDALSEQVRPVYGAPLAWRSHDMDEAAWADMDRVAEHMASLINTDDEGRVWAKLGSRGVLQGYLCVRRLLNLRWSARDYELPMQCIAEFKSPATDGAVRPLADHDPTWLAGLLLAAAEPMVSLRAARIVTNEWLDVLIARKLHHVRSAGAVGLSPHPIDPDALPDSLMIAGQADHGTAIAVRDLHRFAADPGAFLDDLLELERLINPVASRHA